MTMKKVWITLIAIIITTVATNAQTWDEWFRQKKTQKKYLVQQIAALKVYLKFLKEGYDVAKQGLDIVGDIKDGNFNDHSTYFSSLKLVNGNVPDISKIHAIVAYQNAIMKEFGSLVNECNADQSLSQNEKSYVKSVYGNLLSECERAISELTTITTDDEAQMTDDERIERLNLIYADMKDKYSFCRSFCNATRMLMMQRTHEQSGIRAEAFLNGSI